MHLIFVATVYLQSLIFFSAILSYEISSAAKGRTCDFCDFVDFVLSQ